jgi:hypothetical protein
LPKPYSFKNIKKDISVIKKTIIATKKQKQINNRLKTITKEEILDIFKKTINIDKIISQGLTAKHLSKINISLKDILKHSKNNHGILNINIKQLKQLKYSLKDLKNYFSLVELKDYYSIKELKKEYSFKDLRKVFTYKQLIKAYSIEDLKKKYSDLKKIYSLLDELIKIFPLSVLKEIFSLKDLIKYYSLNELKEHFTLEELFFEYSLDDLSKEFSFNKLKPFILKNISYKDLKKTYSLKFIKKRLSVEELLDNYSLKDLKKDFSLNILLPELKKRKYTIYDVISAGYTKKDITKAINYSKK